LPEEDIHLLFDMALKGGGDIPRAQDPRIVLEVILLRMASAPKLTDLKSLLHGSGNKDPHSGTSHSAGGARPYVPPIAPPVKGHQRLKDSQKVSDIPQGLEAMKTALDKQSPARPVQTSIKVTAESVSTNPTPTLANGKSPSEKWLHFVDLVRQDDALFAAKIENLLFAKEEGKLLSLGIPPKLVFLKDQMSDTQIRKKLQGFIDSYWGAGYSFEVLLGRDQVGESAHALLQKKKQLADDEIRNQIEANPMVKAAQEIFKGHIKSIVEIKPNSKNLKQ
jgi:DNA polymerase-3 subunit gamma/tau